MTVFPFIEEEYGIRAGWRPLGRGHIHETFRSEDGLYVLQRINTYVFRDVRGLMENIDRFTAHLRKKLAEAGKDPARGTLTIVKTKDGRLYTSGPDGSAWRIYRNIPDTYSVEYGEQTAEDLRECGRIFGEFQRMADGFPIDTLCETIPHFHDTVKRVEDLRRAASADASRRAESVSAEIEWALSEADRIADVILGPMAAGRVPVTAAHNDAKQNNVLFDRKTGKAVAVIDLDTLMPGSRLYDFGEALRLGCGNAQEDSAERSGMELDVRKAEAFASGSLAVMKGVLTPTEKELLADACRLMCYENGIRFLTDHLEGDVYYGVAREGQNLDRARTQFRMYELFTEQRDALNAAFQQYMQDAAKP